MELKRLNKGRNVIEKVKKNSIAEEIGIEPGDILLSINDKDIKDVIDYKYLISDDYVVVTIQKENGEIWDLEIEKDFDEDLGIIFNNPLMDKAKSCRNKCIFCFIDQLPKGMRKTLYFKDDDSRLSFLQGNFITLTNMSDDEINRMIRYRLSPINISVHTTDPELRKKMLNNNKAGNIYDTLKKFTDAGIQMNCQIVLCPEVNDGIHLEKTINDLWNLYPQVTSVAVVPVGVTKFREGLYKLKTYNYELAKELLEYINQKQNEFLEKENTRFIYASDEFYLLANEKIPEYEEYEGFPQLENGVGLIRLFYFEVMNALKTIKTNIQLDKQFVIATGTIAYKFITEIAELIGNKFKGLKFEVVPIQNNFFGETITVSGLITGKDLIEQLKCHEIKDGVIIPKSMLKQDEDVFLDDVTLEELEKTLNSKIIVCDVDGKQLIDLLINMAR